MTGTTNPHPTLEDLQAIMEQVHKLRAQALRLPVEYRLPSMEIGKIAEAATKAIFGQSEPTRAIATIYGIALTPCEFGRFAVFSDGSFAPLKEGSYDYEESSIIQAPSEPPASYQATHIAP